MKITLISMLLSILFLSCRKAKEGKSYIIDLKYSYGGTKQRIFKIVDFSKHELKVINTNLTYKPEYVFDINKKNISGNMSEINNEMTYCSKADTTKYVINGTITNRKMSGTFRSINTCYPNSPDLEGTFEMDLTKPID